MEIDKTTLNDLTIFSSEEEYSIFSKFDFCKTINGKYKLKENFSAPLSTINEIKNVQLTLKQIIAKIDNWPLHITNGTIMVVERFYQSTLDEIPSNPSSFTAYSYKVFHAPDYSLVKYSTIHVFDFIKGMQELIKLLLNENTSYPLKKLLERAQQILNKKQFEIVTNNAKATDTTPVQWLKLANFVRYHYKHNMEDLLEIHAQLDAWYSMATAVKQYKLNFPELTESEHPLIAAKQLYHVLLETPVAYDIVLNQESNFLFLTGANMAGKSTFIKSVGSAVFLAHIGMGVPAEEMQLSRFDGLLSNINMADNIMKGESYFYNEVQRIKATINKVNNKKHWLILIDELFKGTNIQDAMKCSFTVIEGFLKIKNSLFILSTHLYEIGESLKTYSNISFNYFETTITDDQLHFNYRLKEGISNDRLGYLILKKEGVVDMLQNL
ncbi:MutS-related protein [Ferruginibacter albus]|uniref:MutS-related protein n=1 Tax=Ferruginibacter albus TaxID=2875540 RepID=UPI001CC5CFDA|nr:DNA mismatch repair protein MutS [Ferruginibacter albus]UAY52501.1 DNA mismatch repair protein MutS [Ferruginibacter albus]